MLKTQTAPHRFRLALPFLLIAFAAGCASSTSQSTWTGPRQVAPVTTQPWSFSDQPAKALRTPHYLIHTTIEDEAVLHRLSQVLEGAYAQYQQFAPAADSGKPMNCYIFRKRSEWAAFTSARTGADASIYLQITRGGYAIGDWFVSYYVDDRATFSVAAHEGWHQYVARHFKGRLPPFLEEGTACMFERVVFSGDLPRWDLSINPNRAQGLRQAIERNVLFPLDKLCAMHAGDVVHLPGDKIEAFYAQNWAFARFLWEANGARYRERFKKLLADTAAGTVRDPSGTLQRVQRGWSPSSVQPMLEDYLGKPLAEIESEYRAFIQEIAYTQFRNQWLARPN